jgi:uncharacterized membrane protein YphA (DoxX/SURF4 family)
MKYIIIAARIFSGLVFVYSGFVKAIDPFGSAIKFEEYFEAFGFGFLDFSAFPLAILLSAAELMLGINLIAGLRMKFTAWLLLIFMTFFTLLTFVLALTNPVSDCGCFGDAVKLTNWQTFWKNIILLAPVVVVFIYRKKPVGFLKTSFEWILVAFNFLIVCMLSVYCILHQPLLDFRPYKTGTHIPESMVIPDGAPMDEYETILVYEKDGISQEFTDQDYPWQDTTWKWVETRQNLTKKGYEPPIHDFSITDREGNDITDRVLHDTGYTLFIITPDVTGISEKELQQVNILALRCQELGFAVLGLTSSANTELEIFTNAFQPAFSFYTADETTLQTIIRANPGILLLREGTILGKWNTRDAPGADEFENNMLPLLIAKYQKTTAKFSVLLLVLAVLLFYSAVFYFTHRSNKAI